MNIDPKIECGCTCHTSNDKPLSPYICCKCRAWKPMGYEEKTTKNEKLQCGCMCHTSGNKFMVVTSSFAPQGVPCCNCNLIAPMVKKTIEEFEKEYPNLNPDISEKEKELIKILSKAPGISPETIAIHELFKHIESLTKKSHERHTHQTEENQKVSKRLDELEEQAKERAHLINYKSYLALSDKTETLESRIKECERFQDITHEQYKFVIKKKPHICPVCKGEGGSPFRIATGYDGNPVNVTAICKPCDGSGVVWG